MSKGKMKFVHNWLKVLVFFGLAASALANDGYSDGTKHDTENAINEIENHLHAIENDQSLPSSEEQRAYKSHFASHNNSLDSISDFAYGKEGEAHHSSQAQHSEPHDHEHDHEHHHHHGRKRERVNVKMKTMIW